MATIPKAKHCEIKKLTVHPDEWNHYPSIAYSSVVGCHFENLSKSTKVERSSLKETKLESKANGSGSTIERSALVDCEVIDSSIERSDLKHSTVSNARLERSQLRHAKVSGPKVKVERSQLDDCEVTGTSTLERSQVRESLVEDVKMDRSPVTRSYVTKSTIERASVTDCDVSDCKIERSSFKGMILRNGRWKGGDLVDRIDPTKEVTITKKTDVQAQRSGQSQVPLVAQQSPPLQQTTGVVSPPVYNISISQEPMPSRDFKEAEAASELERSAEFIPESYEGPSIEEPPSYEESTTDQGEYAEGGAVKI